METGRDCPPTDRLERPGRCFPAGGGGGQCPRGPGHAAHPSPRCVPGPAALTARPPRELSPRPPHRAPDQAWRPASPAGSAGPRRRRRRRRRARERGPRAEKPGTRRQRLASAPPGSPRRRRAAGSGSAQTGFSCSRPNRQATPRGGAGGERGRGLTSPRRLPANRRPRAGGGPARSWKGLASATGGGRASPGSPPPVSVFRRPGARLDVAPTPGLGY